MIYNQSARAREVIGVGLLIPLEDNIVIQSIVTLLQSYVKRARIILIRMLTNSPSEPNVDST